MEELLQIFVFFIFYFSNVQVPASDLWMFDSKSLEWKLFSGGDNAVALPNSPLLFSWQDSINTVLLSSTFELWNFDGSSFSLFRSDVIDSVVPMAMWYKNENPWILGSKNLMTAQFWNLNSKTSSVLSERFGGNSPNSVSCFHFSSNQERTKSGNFCVEVAWFLELVNILQKELLCLRILVGQVGDLVLEFGKLAMIFIYLEGMPIPTQFCAMTCGSIIPIRTCGLG